MAEAIGVAAEPLPNFLISDLDTIIYEELFSPKHTLLSFNRKAISVAINPIAVIVTILTGNSGIACVPTSSILPPR